MKILSIGDVHGRSYWKIPILGYDKGSNTGSKTTIKDFDKVVFVGDYVDSFDINNLEINSNLDEIIKLKKKYPNKVELLLGNHDIQYLLGANHRCSGYRPEMQWDLGDMFFKNKDLFKVAFQYENYLWSHAGVHAEWMHSRFQKWIDGDGNLADHINNAFEHNENSLFDVCRLRGGYKPFGGPFWADKRTTSINPLKGYHQIVGHTPVDKISTFKIDDDTSITFIDTQMDLIDEFLIINI